MERSMGTGMAFCLCRMNDLGDWSSEFPVMDEKALSQAPSSLIFGSKLWAVIWQLFWERFRNGNVDDDPNAIAHMGKQIEVLRRKDYVVMEEKALFQVPSSLILESVLGVNSGPRYGNFSGSG